MNRREFLALTAAAPFALRAAADGAAAVALVTCDAEARLAVVDLGAFRVLRSIRDARRIRARSSSSATVPSSATPRSARSRSSTAAACGIVLRGLRRAAVHGRASRPAARVRHRLGAQRRHGARRRDRAGARPRQAAGLGAPPDDRPCGPPAVGRPRLGLGARRRRRRRRTAAHGDADARLRRARRRRRAGRAAVGDRRSASAGSPSATPFTPPTRRRSTSRSATARRS